MLNTRSRYWLVTLNNPVRPFMDPPIRFDEWRTQPLYACYQLEVGQEEGTPHFQLYLAFANPIRGSTVSRALGGNPHLETRRGTHSQASELPLTKKEKKNSLFFSRQRRTV
jgi:hypothetical protein